MDPVTGAIVAAIGAAFIAAIGSIAVALITRSDRKKISETHFQTTKNGGKNSPPTIPDQLHVINDKLDDLSDKFTRHIEWHLEQKK